MEALHIPSTTAAIHLLCRVEQRQDLTYSTRELSDSRYHLEANISLAQKFVEGLSLRARGARGVEQLAVETVPYALWMLSAGQGSSALDRAATSVELLSKGEQSAFQQHAATLRALGLSYVAEREETVSGDKAYRHLPTKMKIRLEPPIEQFVKFSDLGNARQEIPPAVSLPLPKVRLPFTLVFVTNLTPSPPKLQLKEMLSRKAVHERMRDTRVQSAPTMVASETTKELSMHAVAAAAEPIDHESRSAGTHKSEASNAKRVTPSSKATASGPPTKKAKPQNFLIAGARKAKAARSARTAARVGFDRGSKKNKLSNTGSGVPISQVVRLKYVKGFTQAVRTPCRLEDLA